jgi:shikimate kinase
MGSGKTTVGRCLARILKLDFLDLDAEIEARCGAGIPWIFDVEGEQGFRDRETAMLREAVALPGVVVATGGGIVLREENRDLLRKAGVVVYLAVPPSVLFERTRNDQNRPLLQVPNRREVIERLVVERDPLYREVATLVYGGARKSARASAEEVAQLIAEQASPPGPELPEGGS